MFILYAVPLGLIVGVLLGGSLAGLASIQFRWAGLALFGFAAQVVLFSEPVTARVGGMISASAASGPRARFAAAR